VRVELADESFNARFSARGKTYRYVICTAPVVRPTDFRYVYHYRGALDVARTAIRRAERRTIGLEVRPEVLTYLNRASDAVYALARYTDEPDPQLFGGRS